MHGRHVVAEIELIGPQLFVDHAPDRGRLFAASVRAFAGWHNPPYHHRPKNLADDPIV
jgi:hypothetical protein